MSGGRITVVEAPFRSDYNRVNRRSVTTLTEQAPHGVVGEQAAARLDARKGIHAGGAKHNAIA